MNDYISREKAIETIQYRVCQGHGNKEHICKRGSCAYCGIMEVMSDISGIESEEVQLVKHGQWSECYTDTHHYSGICSVCGKASIKSLAESLYEYCPKCGARMDSDTNE